jgi:hypothetical protein
MSELGSLSVEFTRLAQITKEPRYYDAVARITNEFEAWQGKTRLPGMWPIAVDASGCRLPEATSTDEQLSLGEKAVRKGKNVKADKANKAGQGSVLSIHSFVYLVY